MAMNWTGGTRNRAIKTSTTSRLQKRYFAKVRAAAQTFAVPSSQGSLPHVFKRKRRTTPEFDIVVKKARGNDEETVRKGVSLLLHIDRDTVRRERREVEGDIRKARRRMLLEREDWVCTTLARPLVLKSREEMRMLKANFHREATQTSSSGSTSSEEGEEEEDDDDDSSSLRDNDKQGVVPIACECRRRVVSHEDPPELPEYPEDEDIYIRIGGSTQKSSPSAANPIISEKSTSRSTGINTTAIRGSSADTMLLDFEKHELMFQFQHITPSVSDIVERKRREARQSGFSSSPLARYSRQRGNGVSGQVEEVGEDDLLIEEVERASSHIPSSSVHSTIALRDSPNAHGKECLCTRAEGAIGYGLPGIASLECPIGEKIRKEETLGHSHMASATLGSSQISWSTSPAERRPYQHRGEQLFDGMTSDIVSDGELINTEPLVDSADGTWSQVGMIPGAERDMHGTGEDEDEEGRCDESPRIGDPDSSGTEEIVESEAEESGTEMDQDDHPAGDNQDSTDPMSLDSDEGGPKDTLESTNYKWDEGGTAITREGTGEILGTIHVASTIAHEDTFIGAIGAAVDDPTPTAQQNYAATQGSLRQTEHRPAVPNLAGCGNTQDSLGSTVDDQELFTHNEWLDKILATSSDLFKSSPVPATERGEAENRETNAGPLPNPPEPETSKPPGPTPTKKHEKLKRPAQRFLIPPDEPNKGSMQRARPFRVRRREDEIRRRHQQYKQLPHPPPENVTSPVASPVALVYSRPNRLGVKFREPVVNAGDSLGPGAGGRGRKVGGKRENGGKTIVRDGDGGEVEDIEDFE